VVQRLSVIRSFDIARAEAVLKDLGDQIEDLWMDMAARQLGFSRNSRSSDQEVGRFLTWLEIVGEVEL